MKRVSWLISGWLLLLTVSLASLSAPQDEHSLTPDEIRTTLLQGSPAQLAALSSNLKLVIPKRTRQAATTDIPCDSPFDSVNVNYLTLQAQNSLALINSFSQDCEYIYLIVLEKDK